MILDLSDLCEAGGKALTTHAKKYINPVYDCIKIIKIWAGQISIYLSYEQSNIVLSNHEVIKLILYNYTISYIYNYINHVQLYKFK